MCYCNYLNDREDYCGSEVCNKVARDKSFPLKINLNNWKTEEHKNYLDRSKLKINKLKI